MTEQEFMKHVWRPYDTVEVIGDITGAVLNVCFPVKSVKISLPGGAAQWFKCHDIVQHISRTDTPDDMSIIEDLHNKLMAANKRNDDQQKIIDDYKKKMEDLKQRAATSSVATLRKQVNVLIADLVVKKKLIGSIESATARINDVLDRIEEG